ncbi:unnamed protein product [Pelagomonas calceolata]|uniref:Uncharacterized protein n=2 Tax=Pelagomonas calceolata TaxID=35677 RepID=A0A8J2T155_9STRA|nr:unnamed protein product [Pelagomonas calceolata]
MVRLTLATSLLTTAFALAPSVGTVVKGNRKITVIGTAHTPSRRQREEVEALIAEVKPDAVLVELDAERLEFAWNQPEEAYGGELAAAVRAARRIDAPVVLGDACRPLPAVVEARPLFDLERTRRAWRLLVKKPVATGVGVERIDVAQALASDPRKALPLLFAASVGAVATAATAQATPIDAPVIEAAADAVAIASSIVSARVADVLLVARDDVLSENALRALDLGSRLRSSALERHRFRFGTDPAECRSAAAPFFASEGPERPFLTLRSPLSVGERRRMNLFEPRWLALLDNIAGENGGSLLGASLATIHAANRCYLRDGDGVDADVVVDPHGACVAKIERVEESKRPSGARRVAVWLRGVEAVRAEGLATTNAGFLTGRVATDASDDDEAPGGAASVVAVVGLAHANPILERCAERGLLSSRERGGIDQEVARAIAERKRAAALEPLAWEEYDRANR